jgi:hypothetical protein
MLYIIINLVSNYSDNELFTITVVVLLTITYFTYIKSTKTTNSPRTFNLSPEQLKEIQDTLDETPNSPGIINLNTEELESSPKKLKRKFDQISSENELDQTPQNFSHEEIKEFIEKMERGESIDQETLDKIDQDFHNLVGEEEYNNLYDELDEITVDFTKELVNILSNL